MTGSVSVVIVGHVDHGKSTFTGRLLHDTGNLAPEKLEEIRKASAAHGRRLEFAYVTDQFEEERRDNVTIDTTQTFFSLDGRSYVLVDAPGHREYLKNMITGATQARHAILILDVNEGVREQTDKHARILSLLGLRHVAVLVNKMDMVRFDRETFRRHAGDIVARMRAFGMSPAAVIPVSAYDGDNVATRSTRMAWYDGPIAVDFLRSCADRPAERARPALRFPVQLVMERDGRRLLMGRVEQGGLSEGQTAFLFPGGGAVQVRRVVRYRASSAAAEEGECVALEVASTVPLKRGDVLTDAPVAPADEFSVHGFWAAADPLKTGDKILVECRTQSAVADVLGISDAFDTGEGPLDALRAGDVGRVRLRSRTPLLIDGDDGAAMSRLVLHRGDEVAGCAVVARAA